MKPRKCESNGDCPPLPRLYFPMKIKSKEPFIPAERRETVRIQIISLLKGNVVSAKVISSEVGIPERDVYEHLEHIRVSMNRREDRLIVVPAECERCGFVFRKRERLKRLGKCPVCNCESIRGPLFTIEGQKERF